MTVLDDLKQNLNRIIIGSQAFRIIDHLPEIKASVDLPVFVIGKGGGLIAFVDVVGRVILRIALVHEMHDP
jgi:hypothetical protein